MPISDLSSLKNLKNLRRIDVNSIDVSDNIASIQVLETLPNLVDLALDNLKKIKATGADPYQTKKISKYFQLGVVTSKTGTLSRT